MTNDINTEIKKISEKSPTDAPPIIDPPFAEPSIQKNTSGGCLKPLLFFLGFLIFTGLLYLGISYVFTKIPQVFSYLLIILGVLFFLVGKLLMSKKTLFYKSLPSGDIELSSPKYIDYLLWGGQILGILGLMMLELVLTFFKNNLGYGIVGGALILGWLFIRMIHLRFQTNDKIIIGDNSIVVDTWALKKRNIMHIKRESISKVVYLKNMIGRRNSRHFRIDYSICIDYTVGNESKRFSFKDHDFNIDRNILIETLKEKKYLVHLETEKEKFLQVAGEKLVFDGHIN